MAYSAIAVANAFIDKAKAVDTKDLTPMKLQKLVFIANGWMLALEGKPLIKSNFEVWRHGPVEPTLYHALKKYGSGPITRKITSWKVSDDNDFRTITPVVPASDEVFQELLSEVWNTYGDEDAFTLSAITHLPDSPWSMIKNKFGFNKIIPNNVIKNYYSGLLKD